MLDVVVILRDNLDSEVVVEELKRCGFIFTVDESFKDCMEMSCRALLEGS